MVKRLTIKENTYGTVEAYGYKWDKSFTKTIKMNSTLDKATNKIAVDLSAVDELDVDRTVIAKFKDALRYLVSERGEKIFPFSFQSCEFTVGAGYDKEDFYADFNIQFYNVRLDDGKVIYRVYEIKDIRLSGYDVYAQRQNLTASTYAEVGNIKKTYNIIPIDLYSEE